MLTENDLILNFSGPFKFTKGDNYLFDSDLVSSEGIYIWTIKDELNHANYVHYVGETKGFGKRQREHVFNITGMNYRIIDAESARQGIEKIVWNGTWRDKSSNAVATMLENYGVNSKQVIEYISLINVYFAPTQMEPDLRKHIEGCIGWNFRKNHPELKRFYPDDNHVGTKEKWLGQKLIMNLPEEIAGIDNEQLI